MQDYLGLISGFVAILLSIFGYLQTARETSANIKKQSSDIRGELLEQLNVTVDRLGKLSVQVTELNAQIVAISLDRDELALRVETLSEENKKLKQRIDELTVEVEFLEKKNNKFRKGVRLLVAQIKELGLEPAWTPPDELA